LDYNQEKQLVPFPTGIKASRGWVFAILGMACVWLLLPPPSPGHLPLHPVLALCPCSKPA